MPAQSIEGLAQGAARKNVTEAEWLQSVEQDDIQIACQAAVLKAVVEQDQLARVFLDRLPRGGNAIGILQMRHVRQRFFQLQSLVVARITGGFVTATYQAQL